MPINVRNISQHIFSVCWILFLLRICLFENNTSILDYLIWMLCIIMSVVFLGERGKRKENRELKIQILFWIFFLVLQVVGILQNITGHAVRGVVGSFCIMCVYLFNALRGSRLRKNTQKVIGVSFWTFVFLMIVNALGAEKAVKNTLPALIVFISWCYLLLRVIEIETEKVDKKKTRIFFVEVIVLFLLNCFLSVVYHSRTPILVSVVIFSLFVFFNIVELRAVSLKIAYWVGVGCVIFFTYLYMHITEFSWYNTINQYSNLYFNKNLDSGRPHLWRSIFEQLEGIEILFGKGTGVLPTWTKYESVHNSFLQIVLQNGLLGLVVIIMIFWYVWKINARKPKSLVSKLSMSILVGIILLNCFETTLLSNKAFLGTIQWMILGISMAYSQGRKRADDMMSGEGRRNEQ